MKLNPEDVWLRCLAMASDVLCDPKRSIELADVFFEAFMFRFYQHEVQDVQERNADQ